MTASGLPARAERLAARLRRAPSPAWQRVLLAGAVVVFVTGGLAAVGRLDLAAGDLRWGPLLVAALLGVPLSVLANGLEYGVSARIVGHRIRLGEAIGVSLLASAANILPVPGSALVRIQALAASGTRYRTAASSTVLMGLVWLGTSAAVAGAWLLPAGGPVLGAALLAAGAAALVAAWLLLRGHRPAGVDRRTLAGWAVAVELLAVVVNGLRLLLVMVGLGLAGSPATALVLALAVVLASAVGFLPAGVGLREILGAALAPLVALPASAGFLVIAVDRVVGLVGTAPLAAVAALTVGRRRTPANAD
jgi:hypothetical protein